MCDSRGMKQIKEGIEAKNETFDYAMERLNLIKSQCEESAKELHAIRSKQVTLADKVECERRERAISSISNALNLLTFEIEDSVCRYLKIDVNTNM